MSHFVAATLEGSGRDQSRTWWEILEAVEGRRLRIGADVLHERISVASGRSVRRMRLGEGSVCRMVMPTMPQPAPSSRMLGKGDDRVDSSMGRRGNGELVI